MALPKKQQKLNISLNPPQVGTEFLEYGSKRVEELLSETNANTNYLPKTIRLEDIDDAVFEYVNSGNMNIPINGKKVFTQFANNERWGELSKNWIMSDKDNNVITPFITVRRIAKEQGTRIQYRFRTPQPKTFPYYYVPIVDDGVTLFLVFRSPEPVNVDLTYEVRLFSKYIVDINEMDEQVLRNFAARQEYININGNPMPLLLEAMDEEDTITNANGDRYYVTRYELKTLAFILDEKEFEITKTSH
jgi:hypothetical protein